MSGAKNWNGFDYRTHQAVTYPRPHWRKLIQSSHRTQRVDDGSLLLYARLNGSDRIILEVYDRDRQTAKQRDGTTRQ